MAKLKVLVTGGAGFVGSHLCQRLIEDHEVICLDNLYTGEKSNIQSLLPHPEFTFIPHDVTIPFSISVDRIYNLACPASPIQYQKHPILTSKTSILGAINMLELANDTGARILQASTSEIYGDPLQHPQIESYWGNVNINGLRSCYDESKRMAETLFTDYGRQGTDIRIVRIFNTYGPRMAMNDGRVVSNFIIQALTDQDLTIYGVGGQSRSFQYIDDLIDGMITVMEGDISSPVNIGNPEEYSIMELAEEILSLTHSKSKINFMSLPEDDPCRRKPDITLARSLGWSPRISLTEGLVRTIDYFRWMLS